MLYIYACKFSWEKHRNYSNNLNLKIIWFIVTNVVVIFCECNDNEISYATSDVTFSGLAFIYETQDNYRIATLEHKKARAQRWFYVNIPVYYRFFIVRLFQLENNITSHGANMKWTYVALFQQISITKWVVFQ